MLGTLKKRNEYGGGWRDGPILEYHGLLYGKEGGLGVSQAKRAMNGPLQQRRPKDPGIETKNQGEIEIMMNNNGEEPTRGKNFVFPFKISRDCSSVIALSHLSHGLIDLMQ